MPFEFKIQGPRSLLKSIVYLQIKAQNATSGPPIGPALGQCGIPSAPFCKDFNDRSSIYYSNVNVFVTLFLYRTGEYTFDLKLPSLSFLLMRAVKMKKGLSKPGFIFSDKQEKRSLRSYVKRFKVITAAMLYEIFSYKSFYLGYSFTYGYSFCRKALGTCKSIGVYIYNL